MRLAAGTGSGFKEGGQRGRDTERAKRESPYRSPIAHGYLALSLVAPLQIEIGVLPEAVAAPFSVILVGLDRVRFLAPVKAGARVRLRAVLTEVEPYREVALFERVKGLQELA